MNWGIFLAIIFGIAFGILIGIVFVVYQNLKFNRAVNKEKRRLEAIEMLRKAVDTLNSPKKKSKLIQSLLVLVLAIGVASGLIYIGKYLYAGILFLFILGYFLLPLLWKRKDLNNTTTTPSYGTTGQGVIRDHEEGYDGNQAETVISGKEPMEIRYVPRIQVPKRPTRAFS